MVTPATTTGRRHEQILRGALEKKPLVVLTHQSEFGWRAYKAKMESPGGEEAPIQIRALLPRTSEPVHWPQPGDTVGVTFRTSHKKSMFSTTIERVDWENDHVVFVVPRPNHLQQLQRRVYERVKPPRNEVVAVRFWCDSIPDQAGEERNVRFGQLVDISAGGMRIRVADVTGIAMQQSYKCVFSPRTGAPTLLLDAVLRHHEAADQNRASLGFQFIGLETTAEGRRSLERLARVVSQYQRRQQRR